MGWDFQSPSLSAGPHVSIIAVPLPVGAHRSIRHHPVEWESKLKPWMWKMQTCGSFCLIGSASPGSSWIFTVPLNPGALLLLLPPVAAAGLDAANTNRARPVMKVRTPDALRILWCLLCWICVAPCGAIALRRRQGTLQRKASA